MLKSSFSGIFFAVFLCLLIVRADDIYFLDNRPPVHGKTTPQATTIHPADGSLDINLADVLEANFNPVDFHLDYFSSQESPAHLPPTWQGQNIGPVLPAGTYAYADGALTLASGLNAVFDASDQCYFMAKPWGMEEGQWTMRIKEWTDQVPVVGFMLRTGLEPGAPMFAYGFSRESGFMSGRYTPNSVPGRDTRFYAPAIPGWIRLTRYWNYLMVLETSSDGKTWDMSAQEVLIQGGVSAFVNTTIAGIFATGNSPTAPGKVVLDHITFTPSPAEPETLRPGVLLRSGTYLAGGFNNLDAQGGSFNRKDKTVTMTVDQVSAVMWEPTTLSLIRSEAQQSGLIMKNNDFMASDLQSLSGAGAQMNSVIMGPMGYVYTNDVRACVLHPFQLQPSDYEVRLKDGSDIRASSLDLTNGQFSIHEVSGIVVPVDPGEIAQIRAGSKYVESLIRLPWKSSQTAATAKGAEPSPDPNPMPPVRCWEGRNQEQIMAVTAGTALEFPLAGKFRAIAMRIALLSDQPKEQTVVRILANGKEVGRTPLIKAGDAPLLVQVPIPDTKSVTFVADTLSAPSQILYLDPVAIRN